ncbi:type II secretion system F family protein [Amycolatopsis acidicola]|nr:type II secretion system F family protein [Amycolatopsis acidicola]
MALLAAALVVLPGQGAAHARFARLMAHAAVERSRFPWPGKRKPQPGEVGLAARWDLLAACLRAGMPVPAAIDAIIEELVGPEADALRAASVLLALGADAAEAWAPARDCPGTAELARSARRTARSGSALAQAAEEIAAQSRASLADRAEEKAQRAGVLIAGPLALCFLPAFLCLGVVPVVLGLAGRLTV